MRLNRYHLPCRSCEGRGYYTGTDGEGNHTHDECPWCTRGKLTLLLNEQDERDLHAQLSIRLGVK